MMAGVMMVLMDYILIVTHLIVTQATVQMNVANVMVIIVHV